VNKARVLFISSHPIIQADLEEGEKHIDGVFECIDIGVARILFDADRKDGNPEIEFLGQEEQFGIEREAFYGDFPEKVERDSASEELETALRVGKFKIAEKNDLQKVKPASQHDAVPRGGFFEA